MKTRISALTRVLLGTLLLSSVLFTQSAFAQTPMQGSAPMKGMGKAGGRERHPAIRQAIGALERAKADMQRANHDFGGHRVDAIKACDDAIAQLKQALNYDKK